MLKYDSHVHSLLGFTFMKSFRGACHDYISMRNRSLGPIFSSQAMIMHWPTLKNIFIIITMRVEFLVVCIFWQSNVWRWNYYVTTAPNNTKIRITASMGHLMESEVSYIHRTFYLCPKILAEFIFQTRYEMK